MSRNILEEYATEIRDKNPEIADAIEELINNYKSTKIEARRIQEMLAHELKSPLTSLLGYSNLLESGKMSENQKLIAYKIINNAGEQMRDLVELLNLSGSSREELKQESKYVNLEDVLRRQAIIYEHSLTEEKIVLKIKYNRPDHKPISVYANPGVINTILGTLLGNSVCWAPSESRITEAIKITSSKNLEFMIENRYSGKKERENHGMGKGRGFPFVRSIINEFNGSISTYRTKRISSDYDVQELFGYKEDKSSDGEIFGVKLTVPMSELSFEEQE